MSSMLFGTMLLVAMVLVLTTMILVARNVLMPARPVTLTINGSETISVTTGEKLLPSLLTHDVLVPSTCGGSGTCGLCRVRVLGDERGFVPVEEAKISKADRASGTHLACQYVLRNDLAVEVPQEWVNAKSYTCEVLAVRPLTPLIREIVLQIPGEIEADIVAGSYAQVTAPPFKLDYSSIEFPEDHADVWRPIRGLKVSSPEEVTRAYSIANRAEDTLSRRIVLNIRLALPPPSVPDAPPGIVSSWLFALKEGDSVTVSGPFGTFRAQPTDREMVFIGGGVGMAPLRALIHEQLDIAKSRRKMSFWYGARNSAELLYAEELDALAKKHENFSWTVALSDPKPDSNWKGHTGFIHKVVFDTYLRDHPEPESCEYYLCGPPMMIRAVLQMLDELGVDPDRIFNDDFGV